MGFSPLEQGGWRVDGHLRSVEVEAPRQLEPLASLERDRSTKEAFPLHLDAEGLIVTSAPRDGGFDLDRTVKAAMEAIRHGGGDPALERRTRWFLIQLDQAGSALISRFPQDLFFPSTAPVTERRMMDLPDGLSGELEMSYSAQVRNGSDLLLSCERRVITRIGNEAMTSLERWELG